MLHSFDCSCPDRSCQAGHQRDYRGYPAVSSCIRRKWQDTPANTVLATRQYVQAKQKPVPTGPCNFHIVLELSTHYLVVIKLYQAYLGQLVRDGVFKEIYVSFLPVGHTHEDIDQMFR